MGTLKAQKELEQKLHEEFYKNVYILTLIYPTTKEFNAVFKKDMFLKNNKVGFHHVVYYLLSVLDADKLQQKVQWPLLDIRGENQFRNDIMKYINELNTVYEGANIPRLATSHLICPGGFKFMKFMYKLSQLVLQHIIQKRPNILHKALLPIRPSKNEAVTLENIKTLQAITRKIDIETEQLKVSFEEQLNAAKVEANEIIAKKREISQKIQCLQEKSLFVKNDGLGDFSTALDESEKEVDLQAKLTRLQSLKLNADKCKSLMSQLDVEPPTLQYDKDLKLPLNVSHIVHCESEELDLANLLEGFNILTVNKRLEFKPLQEDDVVQQGKRLAGLNDQFNFFLQDMEKLHTELLNFHGNLLTDSTENVIKKNCGTLQDMEGLLGSPVLAVPLPLSPSDTSVNIKNFKTSSPF